MKSKIITKLGGKKMYRIHPDEKKYRRHKKVFIIAPDIIIRVI